MQEKTKNMEKVMTERELPQELLMLVLARLPWQDTLRLRRVCKQWSCILQSPQFLKLCSNSPSRGVPLFLSSAFSEIDSTLYHHRGIHKCLVQGGLCHDCEFQLLSPADHKWNIFPRTWFNSFLQEGLFRTGTRCLRLVGVKGGIFLIFFRRQLKSTTTVTNDSGEPPISAAVDDTCSWVKLQTDSTVRIPWTQNSNNSEIVFLVNPFNQTYRPLSLPTHLQSKGSSLYWMKIKKLVVDKQSDTFEVLLGPTVRKCDKHERCDIWRLDCYDMNQNLWSRSFSFHLGRTVTIMGGDHIQQSVDAGWLYDATVVGEKLFFITCHSDSLFGVWQFASDSESIFPTRLADIPLLNLYKPSLHESAGRLMILGQSFNMDELDFSFSIWEYEAWSSRWIQLVSIFSSLQPRVACWKLKGDFGQDLACISIESAGRSEYFVCDLNGRTSQNLQGVANGRKLFMIEPRLDMQL